MDQLPHDGQVSASPQKNTRGQRRSNTKCFLSELVSRMSSIETQLSFTAAAQAEVSIMRSQVFGLESQVAMLNHALYVPPQTKWLPMQPCSPEQVHPGWQLFEFYEPDEEADDYACGRSPLQHCWSRFGGLGASGGRSPQVRVEKARVSSNIRYMMQKYGKMILRDTGRTSLVCFNIIGMQRTSLVRSRKEI